WKIRLRVSFTAALLSPQPTSTAAGPSCCGSDHNDALPLPPLSPHTATTAAAPCFVESDHCDAPPLPLATATSSIAMVPSRLPTVPA
ncbi:hypothetical protein BDA96_08G001300, partial [Sorghum bicolor]